MEHPRQSLSQRTAWDQENEIRRSGKHGFSKRKYSRIKLRKMVEEMATAEPLFLTSGERPSKDQYGEHSTPHIVEKELIDTTKSSGGLRIPFNLVDDSQQNRVGIFPITTKEPRRIKITMWPPGYRNHFTKRPLSEVQQNTSTTMPPHAASGTLFTPRMPESFYKVFYPQMKPAKRHRLKGYRNKVLFARRHLKRPKGRVAYNYANAITHRAKHVPAAVTKLPIHRLRPKRPDSLLNQITDEHERTNANVVDNAPSPSAFITPAVSSNESSADEDNNIDDLKFQLMIELEGFIQSQHGRLREEMESELQHERLALLRRPRSEYDAAKRRIGYCELFAACADELKSIEHRCKQNNSRLMPGLPKRRFGQCNAELVPEFKKYDELKQQADNAFDQCFVEELVNEALEDRPIQSEDCPSDWPLLPPYEILDSCHEQIRVVQNHCSKLGKCCSSVDKCREQVANLAITDMVSEMKSIIALKSAECQIKTFKEYSRKRLNEPSAKPPNKIQYDNVITEEDLSFLVADQPEGKHKSTGPYVSQRPLRNMSVD